MGIYINPEKESKEDFLVRVGRKITPTPQMKLSEVPDDLVMVCWANNGPFTAAMIIECEDDMRSSLDPDDPRPRRYYFVKKVDLGDNAPEDIHEAMRRVEAKGERR